jgi:hypothetical protein
MCVARYPSTHMATSCSGVLLQDMSSHSPLAVSTAGPSGRAPVVLLRPPWPCVRGKTVKATRGTEVVIDRGSNTYFTNQQNL